MEKDVKLIFFFKQKTAYDIEYGLVGSEMCIGGSCHALGITSVGCDTVKLRCV